LETLALCIPAYNAAAYLPRLLTSAVNQAIPFTEILVYDDCSTDSTAAIARSYGANVISGSVNKGCSFGKNALAEKTTCQWMHFHDADDDILPGFTTQVHSWIAANNNLYDVLLLNFEYIDAQSGKLLGTGNYNTDELHADALRYAIEHKIVNFGVYKRSSFLSAGGFDLDKKVLYNEDNAFHQRLAKNNLKFDYLPAITCINYRYGKSMSASNELECARANYYVLAGAANTHGPIYPFQISRQLWVCIARLAAGQDWEYVKKALALSKKLGYRSALQSNQIFTGLSRLHPFMAVWLREKMIRWFKPALRK